MEKQARQKLEYGNAATPSDQGAPALRRSTDYAYQAATVVAALLILLTAAV